MLFLSLPQVDNFVVLSFEYFLHFSVDIRSFAIVGSGALAVQCGSEGEPTFFKFDARSIREGSSSYSSTKLKLNFLLKGCMFGPYLFHRDV
ncbi:hypothetical protein M513_05496 [Trichuris suis]|uniref:Uncharacterized protein n=1 Tax=Trichuris suis TaxID=68888 RepID=A0A085M8N4_9BILA|nr:hypothetical protein M513_05496 [Trichuris suis]